MGLVGAVAVTAEQLARATRYEAALSALEQGHFSFASHLASKLLEETPDDLATVRLRDMANDEYVKVDTTPSSCVTKRPVRSRSNELLALRASQSQ
jgi:hypothetical protein